MNKCYSYMLPIAAIALFIASQPATSGFLDTFKEALAESAKCAVSPERYSDSKGGILPANSKIYTGPYTRCRSKGKAHHKIGVNIVGEKGNWYYIQVKDASGRIVDGWAQKSRVTLLKGSIADQKEKKIAKVKRVPSVRKKPAKPAQVYPKEMVAEVQQLLNQHDYQAGVVDGLYGRGTKGAVMSFQRDTGLVVTGKLDIDTLVALRNAPITRSEEISNKIDKEPPVQSVSASEISSVPNTSARKDTTITQDEEVQSSSNKNNDQVSISGGDILIRRVSCSEPTTGPTGIINIFVKHDKSISKHNVAKKLLRRGAEFGVSVCTSATSIFQVFLAPMSKQNDNDLSSSLDVAYANILPNDDYKLTSYVNHPANIRDKALKKAHKKSNLSTKNNHNYPTAVAQSSVTVQSDATNSKDRSKVGLDSKPSKREDEKMPAVKSKQRKMTDRKGEQSSSIISTGIGMKDLTFLQKSCSHRGYNENYVFVEDGIDIGDDDLVKNILRRGAAFGKMMCKNTGSERIAAVRMFPKSLQKNVSWRNSRLWAAASFDLNTNKMEGFNNKEGPRRAAAAKHAEEKKKKMLGRQRAAKARRDPLVEVLNKSMVETIVDVEKLVKNPYVYEGKIALMEARFSTMLSKNEALFFREYNMGRMLDSFMVTNVPTTRFSDDEDLLLVGKIRGKKRYKMPSGIDALVTYVDFVDAYEGDYNESDIVWAFAEAAPETVIGNVQEVLIGEWYEVCQNDSGRRLVNYEKNGVFDNGDRKASQKWSINGSQLMLEGKKSSSNLNIVTLNQDSYKMTQDGSICMGIRKDINL